MSTFFPMARLYSMLLLAFSFLLIFCSTSANIVVDDSAALVDQVCRMTQNYVLCIRSLDSDPRTFSADLMGLARISLDLVDRNATDTRAFISKLIPGTSDPNLLQALTYCSEQYEIVVVWMQRAYEYLDSKDFRGLNSKTNAIRDEGIDCEQALKYTGNSPLGPRNKNLQDLSEITMVISLLLRN